MADQTAVAVRAGCYTIYPGPALHWRPAAWTPVDTATSARLRVRLEGTVDTASPFRPAFVVNAGSHRGMGYYVWQPVAGGIHVAESGADTQFEWELVGDSVLRGSGSSRGSIQGGAYRYAVAAKRVPCEGFQVGYDAPRL